MLRSIIGAAAALCLASTIVAAEEPTRLGEACKGELASICAATGKGEGRGRFSCLVEHEAKLGAGCLTAVKGVREGREKVRVACEADRAKHCPDADGKGGAAMQCLRAKQAELTKPCADALAALPQRTAKQ